MEASSRSASNAASRTRGFSLLEVLVALALLALALTLLLGSMSNGARQIRHSEQASRASLYAQSVLARVDLGDPLQPGQREGEFEQGRYRWTLDVTPYIEQDATYAAPLKDTSARLLQLSLEVRWGKDSAQATRWRTLRLAAAEGPKP